MKFWHGIGRLCLLALLCLALAAPASAHPLGNFSINHQTRVKISSDRIEILYVLDQAEIPTAQERNLSKAEIIQRKRAEVDENLFLVVNGKRHVLHADGAPKLTFPRGAGGLPITRLELPLIARVERRPRLVDVQDSTFEGRIGWVDLVAQPGSGTAVRTPVSASDPTNGLRTCRGITLKGRPDQRVGRFLVKPGRERSRRRRCGQRRPNRDRWGTGRAAGLGRRRFHQRLRGRRERRWDLRRAPACSLRLGCAPRHLAGPRQGDGGRVPDRHARDRQARGCPRRDRDGDPHDWRVCARARDPVPFAIHPARGPLSLAQPRRRAADRRGRPGRSARAPALAAGPARRQRREPRARTPAATYIRTASTATDHDHGHDHHGGHGHTHGGEHHDHHVPETTWKGLTGMGISARIIPCPTALVVLLAAITQEEVALGLLLIVVFSLGLAATLTGLGLGVVYAKRLATALVRASTSRTGSWRPPGAVDDRDPRPWPRADSQGRAGRPVALPARSRGASLVARRI